MPELQSGDPQRLGSYDLLERLGEGGQGVVYLGRGADGTEVAIKLLRADLTEDDMARSRFVREVQAAKQVARFCTAQVIEADVAGDRPYIVSEFVPGQSLQKQVMEEGPRSGAALDRLAIGTVTALVAIHQAGIVHRDFKPHNVLIAPDGPRVIDFGIARALDAGSTASTKAIGTPAYMAPEQVMGAALTEAVDIFSWGSTMVFAATGQPPFGQDTIPAVINRILNQQPGLDQVPDDLRDLIRICLSKDPGQRPTAQELMMRLIGGSSPAATAEGPTRLESAGPMGAAAAGAAAAAGDDLPTAVLAEGQNMAGRTAVGGTPGATLPPVPGYPGYPGETQQSGGPGKKRPMGPIIGAVAAVAAILLLVGGLAYALSGDDKPSSDSPSVAPSDTSSSSEPDDQEQPPPEQTDDPDPPKSNPPSSRPVESPSTEPTTEPTSKPPTTEPGGGGGTSSPGGGGGTQNPGGGDPDGGGKPSGGGQGGTQAGRTP